MGYGSGIGGQFGIATESTVGTAVAVTTFTEFVSEGIERKPIKVQSQGIRAGGLAALASRYTEVAHDVNGPLQLNFPTKGLGKYLQHMLGSFSTTATQIASTAAYQQIHNPPVSSSMTPETASSESPLDRLRVSFP